MQLFFQMCYFASMQFHEVVGQLDTKTKLLTQVAENRISHAQLFLSPHGAGNLALAIAFAQYVLCENKQAHDACGVCAACRKVQKLTHPDLHFSYPFFAKHKEDTSETFISQWRTAVLKNPYLDIDEWRTYFDEDNKQANINIAECHRIIKTWGLKPFEATYKILIMWLPEYLEKEGNTLLKLIEEPPPNTLFILVAHRAEQVLTTILSRTQLIKMPALTQAEISQFLMNRPQVSAEQATQLAYLSEGSLQNALQYLRQEESDYFQLLSEWLRMCFANQGLKITSFVEEMSKMGRENQKNFWRYALKLLREILLVKHHCPQLTHVTEREKNFIANLSKAIHTPQIEALIIEIEKAHYHTERNANPKILFLDVSLQLVKILMFKILPKEVQNIIA